MSSTDLLELWPGTWRPTGSSGTRPPSVDVVRAARAHGLSAVLVDVLADPGQPEVARLRAFGRIAAALDAVVTTPATVHPAA